MAKMVVLTGRTVKNFLEYGDDYPEGAVLQRCPGCHELVFISDDGARRLKAEVDAGNKAMVLCSPCAVNAAQIAAESQEIPVVVDEPSVEVANDLKEGKPGAVNLMAQLYAASARSKKGPVK